MGVSLGDPGGFGIGDTRRSCGVMEGGGIGVQGEHGGVTRGSCGVVALGTKGGHEGT